MSDLDPNAVPSANIPADSMPSGEKLPPPEKRRKKKHWVLRILLVLLLLLILLVAFAPFLASLSPVRGIVVGQVNNKLAGSLEIGSYSVGWTSGISASGIKVYDDRKNLVLDIPKFETGLSLIGAAKGNFNLGKTSAEVQAINIEVYPDGSTSLDHIAKPSAAPLAPSREKTSEPKKSEPIKLPNVKGDIVLNIAGGKISGRGLATPVTISPSTVTLNVPDINQPITNAIALKYTIGNATSSIDVNGTIDAVKNSQLDLDQLKADETVKLTNVDLAAAKPFAADALGPNGQIGGIASGTLAIKAEGITGISSSGQIDIANFLFSGAGLADTLKLDKVAIPLQVTRTVVDANTTTIKIEKLGVNSALVNVDITGQVQQESLTKLANNQAPGADGSITITTSVPKLDDIAKMLPNTMKLAPGVEVTGGSFNNTATITLTKENVTLAQKLDLIATGTRDQKPIEIQPIHLATKATAVPNGKPIPAVQDLDLDFSSSFAKLSGGGASLAAIDIKGDFDLPKLRNEIVQFSDLGDAQMQGTGTLAISTKGDPTGTGPIDASVNVNADHIIVSGFGPATTTQPIQQDRLSLTAGAKLNRDAAGAMVSVDDASVKLQTGDKKSPLVDFDLMATKIDLKTNNVGSFKLNKCTVSDLAAVQKQFGAFVPALGEQRLQFSSGAVYANVAGSYDGVTKKVTLNEPLGLSLPNIVITKADKPFLGREDITGKIGGAFVLGKDATSAKFTDLWIGAKSGLFTIAKSDDAPLEASIPANGGGVKGSGKLNLAANLKALNDLAQAMSATAAAPAQKAGDIKSGMFTGTLALTHDDKSQTDVAFTGDITRLSITTNDKPIDNESAKISLAGSSPDDQSAINVSKANFDSRFANANISNCVVKLHSPDGVWGMVTSAIVKLTVPDLPTAYALIQAFSPTAAPAAPNAPAAIGETINHPIFLTQAPEDGEPKNESKKKKKKKFTDAEPKPTDVTTEAGVNTAPLSVTNGSMTMTLDVKRDASTTAVELSDLTVHQLAIARGTQKYTFGSDINMKLSAGLDAVNDAKKTITDQINSITVKTLTGDLGGVAKFAMPDALNVKGPLSKPFVNGSIKLAGTLDALTPLLAVLQGSTALPYSGDYSLVQKISSANGSEGAVINLGGSFDAPTFKMLGENGKPVFEDSVAMKNDIGAYLDKKTATIRTLDLTMPRSTAVGLSVVGRVYNWDTTRTIKDAKIHLVSDTAALWKLAYPMLSDEQKLAYKDLKTSGKLDRTINVGGAYPARPTWNESVKSLEADGSVGVEFLDLPQGLTVQNLDLGFTLKKGVFAILPGKVGARKPTPEESQDAKANGSGLAGLLGGGDDSSKPNENTAPAPKKKKGAKPAADVIPESGYANTGAINLGGITVDLSTPNFATSVPNDKQLLKGVRLNPVLADTLGKFGAVALVGSDNPKGLVNLRVAECQNVPLGAIATRAKDVNAKLVLSVDDLELKGLFPNLLAQAADLGSDGLQGSIPDSTITVTAGQAKTDLTILVDKEMADEKTGKKSLQGQPIKFVGGLSLADLKLRDFAINIGPELLIRDLRKIAPNGATLPLTGTADKPNLDVGKFISENAIKGLIPGLGGDKSKDGKDDGGGLGGILDQLGKKKKDKEKGK